MLDPGNSLRVRFEVERGQILKFVVQLECRFGAGEEWTPVVRYDTSHGFAHCDRLHPYGPASKTRMATHDMNGALDLAVEDLARNWGRYRRRYEEWLTRK